MSEFEDFYGKIPKRLIAATFVAAMLLDFIPLPGDLFEWLPQFSALTLIYWLIHRPQHVGIGVAFVLGILVDVGSAAPLGQHALAYMLLSYLIIYNHRQIILYNYGVQAVVVLLALLCNELVLMLVRLFYDHRFSGWWSWLSPFVGALLWPMLNKLMVSVLNFRRLRR